MSAPAQARPYTIQQEQEGQNPSAQEISQLAYALWQERGSPAGSPETDWLEAERQLRVAQSATSSV
jgi:hypothetical protein